MIYNIIRRLLELVVFLNPYKGLIYIYIYII
nr:MAG TPA: hypothetical protein [Caudoviricetes sp.]